MAEASNTTVTLQVHRFTSRPERAERARGGSPFAKKSSPFGGGSDSAARRRPRGKQWVQEYTIPARPSDTVLDCLLTIKRTVDPTLHLPQSHLLPVHCHHHKIQRFRE